MRKDLKSSGAKKGVGTFEASLTICVRMRMLATAVVRTAQRAIGLRGEKIASTIDTLSPFLREFIEIHRVWKNSHEMILT